MNSTTLLSFQLVFLISVERVDIEGSSFVANQATSANGGGLNSRLVKQLSILNVTFSENEASSGGGVSLLDQDPSIVSLCFNFCLPMSVSAALFHQRYRYKLHCKQSKEKWRRSCDGDK